jgi:uncharacterized protein YcbX
MRVLSLHVYPVKACRALTVDEIALGPLGLEHDRRFAFVQADGRALTQRDQPLLATIQPRLDGDTLHLDFGGLLHLALPLPEFSASASVDVWGKPIAARALPQSRIAGAADYLGTPVRLVALDPQGQRSFADSRPVLVTTTSALSSLNAGLGHAVGMERFRTNIVLEGGQDWPTLEGKAVRLERDKPCGRCEVTTIDQTSGERRGPEPLQTLSERFAGNFGVYYRVARPGRLRRGETLDAS